MTLDKRETRQIYESHAQDWKDILVVVASDVQQCLANGSIKASMRTRLKTLESLQEKQARPAYDPSLGGADIKDLLGLRILVPFLGDISEVVASLGASFITLEVERKSEELSFREFGYDAVHVIIDIQSYLASVELPLGVPPVCELQIRTYLQDAWAEVEHELIYKSVVRVPDHAVRKKLAALNANLMLADSMFQEIRDYQRDQARWGRARFNELRKKAVALREASVDELTATDIDRHGDVGKSIPSLGPSAQLLTSAIRAHNAKHYDEAIAAYARVLETEQDQSTRSFAYNHRGMALFMIGDESGALKDFNSAVSSSPNNHNALNNRALAWRHLGVVQEALDDFRRSLKLRSAQPEVYFLMAQTYCELDDRKSEALACLREALRLEPDNQDALKLFEKLSE